MWGMGSHFTNEGRSIPSSPYHAMVQDIHVLLVDHETESLMNTAKLLEICSYRVTIVEVAYEAISVLSSGKAKFDIVMANVNSPDLHGFKLLQLAVNMDLPVIMMSADDNAYMALSALENGAFLFIKKPATVDIVRCLWQHVYKEKERIVAAKERFREIIGNKYKLGRSGVEDKNQNYKFEGNGKFKGQKGDDREKYNLFADGSNNNNNSNNKGVKRKVCTEWTQELHAKFMDVVTQLGEGRCFPKDILEHMNTPGLTRMQVASHLQKCRNNNWQSPDQRPSHLSSPHALCDPNGSQHKPRRFGSMPQSVRAHESPQRGGEYETRSKKGPSEPGPNNASCGTNPSSDDFFIFQDPACPIHNFSSTSQGFRTPRQNLRPSQSPNPAPYQYDRTCVGQNSAGASMDSKSQWSSETSNVESDGSATKGNVKSNE